MMIREFDTDGSEREFQCPHCGFTFDNEDDIYSIIGNGCCEECVDELVESGVIQV